MVKYKEYLSTIEKYKDIELKKLLSKLNLVQKGNKVERFNRVKKYLIDQIHIENLTINVNSPNTGKEFKKCIQCNGRKLLNENNFSLNSDKCIDCLENGLKTRVCNICKIRKPLTSENFIQCSTGFASDCRLCIIAKYNLVKKIRVDTNTVITDGIQTKVCYRCDKELAVNDFFKNSSHSDGLDSICKNCDNKRKHGNGDRRLVQLQPEGLPSNMKWCSICNEVKEKSEYYVATSRPDGRQHCCKVCDKRTRLERDRLKRAIAGNAPVIN
jgi:hypothetical protein